MLICVGIIAGQVLLIFVHEVSLTFEKSSQFNFKTLWLVFKFAEHKKKWGLVK